MTGREKVAVLRSYPSMAYNNYDTQMAVNMAEQVLQQRQIPFSIIFDQQIDQLEMFDVLVLADQESLTDSTIEAIKTFVDHGGGLVLTGNTGMYDGWRRLRKKSMPDDMYSKSFGISVAKNILSNNESISFIYGKGRVLYIPELRQDEGETKLGFESVWRMPENAGELEAAVYWAAGKHLPLEVTAPEWVGVSHDHDAKINRDIIHLFNYSENSAEGITLRYEGTIKNAWAVSPDRQGKLAVPFRKENGISVIRMPEVKVYEVLVLEKK